MTIDYEQHRQTMVAHFIMMRQVDAEYARYALATYVRAPGCPFPRIGDDVKAAWAEIVKAQKDGDRAP